MEEQAVLLIGEHVPKRSDKTALMASTYRGKVCFQGPEAIIATVEDVRDFIKTLADVIDGMGDVG